MIEFLRQALALSLVVLCTFISRAVAQAATTAADTTLLTLDRIFGSSEFSERGLGQYQWRRRTASYFTWNSLPGGGKGGDLVRNDAVTGTKDPVVAASAFIPPE